MDHDRFYKNEEVCGDIRFKTMEEKKINLRSRLGKERV